MRHNDNKLIPDIIRAHSVDLKKAFHPWQHVYPKRVGLWRHWKVVGVTVAAVRRVAHHGEEEFPCGL